MQIFSFFRSINKCLNRTTIVSIIIVISTDLWWTELPELFNGGDRLLNTLYNLCIGFIVSYIFYIVVVHYKEYKDKNHIKRVIFPILRRIIENHKQTNECISRHSDIADFTGLCEVTNKEIFSEISYMSNIPQWTNSSALGQCSWITYLKQQTKNVKHSLKQTYQFMSHIDPELVDILNEYNNNTYFFNIRLVSALKSDLQQDMSNLSEVYQKYSQTGEKLNNYVTKHQVKP